MLRSTYAGEKMDFLTSYKSSKDFDDALLRYQEATNAVFRKKTSESSMKSNERTKHKIDTETFHFSRIVFVCTHFGQPTQRGQGKKAHTKHTATGCEASFTVNYDYRDKMLKISKSVLEHNHPTTPETYSQEYRVKRLEVAQKHALKEIVQLQPRNENLMHMINSKYRKALTLSDIRHLKYQLKAGQITDDMTDLVVNLEGLQQHGEVKVVVSNNGNDTLLDIVAFATRPMIELFNKYPEMIYMDATFKNNKSGYPLYQIMVEDGRGKGRTVFYAFVRRETAEVLSSMVGIFCSFMGDAVSRMTHAMTD